MKYRVQVMPR